MNVKSGTRVLLLPFEESPSEVVEVVEVDIINGVAYCEDQFGEPLEVPLTQLEQGKCLN